MIDTDKYEGHTEGPWFASEEEMEEGKAWVMWGGEHWVVMDKSDGHLWIEWMKEDAILAADAPLLLAEVKRLRGLLKITAQSYLDDVRAVDMLGEVSVKKEYETCQEIADVLGVCIVSGHTLHDMFHANGSEFGRYFVYLDEDGEMVMMND